MPQLRVTYHYVDDGRRISSQSFGTLDFDKQVEHEGRRLRSIHHRSLEARVEGEAMFFFMTARAKTCYNRRSSPYPKEI